MDKKPVSVPLFGNYFMFRQSQRVLITICRGFRPPAGNQLRAQAAEDYNNHARKLASVLPWESMAPEMSMGVPVLLLPMLSSVPMGNHFA